MLVSQAKRSPAAGLSRLHARLLRETEGATALEFALLALPFLIVLFQIIELALVFLIYAQLDNAVANASRLIRTGALQTSSTPTASSFTNAVCSNMSWLQPLCLSSLSIDVRTEAQFSNPTEPDPMASGRFNKAVLAFNPGSQGQIILVRAFLPWPLILPQIDKALSRDNNGTAVIVSTTTFVNENYVS